MSRDPKATSYSGQPELPYTLTKGVTATREGLEVDLQYSGILKAAGFIVTTYQFIPWSATERLRYRQGEPFLTYDETLNEWTVCAPNTPMSPYAGRYMLYRLAAILCDDANAFRVLHWCVENLGCAV